MSKLLQFVVAATAAIVILAVPQAVVADDQQSILVTGASTGIGRNLTETLAANGYHVYAGARKDKDLAALNAIDNVTAVKLDVTRQDQVDAVVEMIREKGTGYGPLWPCQQRRRWWRRHGHRNANRRPDVYLRRQC